MVEGRVDVFRGANSLYDSNKIDFPLREFRASPSALRVYTSGGPVNIIPCIITVSNNDISGNDFGDGIPDNGRAHKKKNHPQFHFLWDVVRDQNA